jgi:ribonuclease T1
MMPWTPAHRAGTSGGDVDVTIGRMMGGLVLAALALAGFQSPLTTTTPVTVTSAAAVSTGAGIPGCSVSSLPPEAHEVIDDIHAGGPYDYPRNDGVTFQNREGILPDESLGYYREFTVKTPGVDHRGARRIVTGGAQEIDPEHWYYTADHYESFCEFVPQSG